MLPRSALIALFSVGVAASCKWNSSSAADGGASSGRGIFAKLASLVSFEGEIEMKTSTAFGIGPGSGIATVFKIKGNKMRTEMSALGSAYASITDMDTKKSVSLDTARRTYTESDLSGATATTAKPKSTAKAVATGRKDTVAGYSCDVYEIDDPSVTLSPRTELCVAPGISMFPFGANPFGLFTGGSGGDDAWSTAMSHGFPLRIVMRDTSGGVMAKLEATRVEKKSEDDSQFEVPAGYTKLTFPSSAAPTSAGSTP